MIFKTHLTNSKCIELYLFNKSVIVSTQDAAAVLNYKTLMFGTLPSRQTIQNVYSQYINKLLTF